ncbi:MAG: FecR family protein [Algibacter sp.]
MKKTIIKFITNRITEEELESLYKWLSSPENQSKFENYILDYHDLNLATLKNDVEEAYSNVKQAIDGENKRKKVIPLYKTFVKYAAAIIILVASSYFFLTKNTEGNTKNTVVNDYSIQPGTDKAILTLANGSEVVIEKGENYETENITSNGEEIIYDKATSNEIAYNTLTIPRGGQHKIILSDSTQVWLNSESQLKYPVSFIKGETRVVELVYGEAYFDVSPSTEHQDAKFKVLNNAQELEVLGTEFNIKAYKDEVNIYTTLVEGKVEVTTQNGKKILEPNQQSNVNLSNQNITVSMTNVYDEISWKKGVFSFNGKSLEEIMKVLSRWYDMEVEFTNNDIENEEFIGVLGRTQEIEGVLSIIKNFGIIENYEINNRKVTLR